MKDNFASIKTGNWRSTEQTTSTLLANSSHAKKGRPQDGRQHRFTYSVHNNNAFNILDAGLCKKQTMFSVHTQQRRNYRLLLNDL